MARKGPSLQSVLGRLVLFVFLASMPGCAREKAETGRVPEDAGREAGRSAKASAESRSPAPDFLLKDLSGREVKLSGFRGKVVIVDFWATWCPPCREEIPGFVDLQRQYKDQGLEVVGISVDQGGADVVGPFARQNRINYTMLVDGIGVAGLFGGIQGIPTTFVLDRQGRIVKRFTGLIDRAVFEDLVKQLLAEA